VSLAKIDVFIAGARRFEAMAERHASEGKRRGAADHAAGVTWLEVVIRVLAWGLDAEAR
jgi:hypothetical protein